MKRAIVTLVLAVTWLTPEGAIGESLAFKTGYDLYHATLSIEDPNSDEELLLSIRAMGFIGGFVDGIIFTQDSIYNSMIPKDVLSEKERTEFAKKMNFNRLNLPKTGIAIGQGILIYQNWAKRHPEELNNTMRLCLWLSFVEAYGWK